MSHNKSLENDLKLEKREKDDNIISKIYTHFWSYSRILWIP